MDSQDPNANQLNRLEQKLDELIDNQEYMMKSHGRFHGAVYGVLGGLIGGYGIALLTNYLGWF
jgi:hypothetical protein